MKLVLLIIIAYVLGSIPNALWIGKVFKGIDVREHGSKNTGSTNAARVLGAKYGVLTLILDVAKGSIPVILGKIFLDTSQNFSVNNIGGQENNISLILIGLAAILGHSFSIFMKFKGGKAVATTLGVFLILVPYAILVTAIAFFIVFFMYRYVSLSSVIAATVLPIAILFIYHNVTYTLFGLIIAILIIVRHRSNIERLKNGTETKFTIKKK